MDNLPIFQLFSVFSWKFEGNFIHFFQCSLGDLSLSLMQPASHSEFETPVLERLIESISKTFEILFHCFVFCAFVEVITRFFLRLQDKKLKSSFSSSFKLMSLFIKKENKEEQHTDVLNWCSKQWFAVKLIVILQSVTQSLFSASVIVY